MTSPDLIRFLRACDRADNRAGAVSDPFAASVELRRSLDRDILLRGELDWRPAPELRDPGRCLDALDRAFEEIGG